MEYLLSPWFSGLSVLSLLVMILILWGVNRSCRHFNTSPIGIVGRKECPYPCKSTFSVALLYILLTVSYVFAPPLIHALPL